MHTLWAWSLGMYLLCSFPAPVQQVFSPLQQQAYSPQAVIKDLIKADVIYLGETHDNPADHKAQLEIIQALHRQHPRVAIAMEMFQRPYQPVLDQYLAGKLTEAQLLEQSQFQKRWGYAWEYYAPILRFAKQNRLPVLALNTPTEVTRKVAREGYESLSLAERRFVPPRSELRTDNPDYRQLLLETYQAIHQGQTSSRSFERFFLAQVLWDETMADRIASFVQQHRDTQVIVLAGQGHIIYGYDIPNRVARRLRSHSLIQRSLLLNPSLDTRLPTQKVVADYLWITSD